MSAVDVQQSSAVPSPAGSSSSSALEVTEAVSPAPSSSSSSRRSELALRFGDATKDNWQQVPHRHTHRYLRCQPATQRIGHAHWCWLPG